jgi:hypothetical protein
MYTVVPESGVTLDTRLLGQDVIILSLEITDNLREALTSKISISEVAFIGEHFLPCLIVDLITKSRSVNNGQ